METEKSISVSDASLLLQVSERQIRRYCTEGRLRSWKEGNAYRIDYGSVLEFIRKDGRSGTDEGSASEEDACQTTDTDNGGFDVQDIEPGVRNGNEEEPEDVREVSDAGTTETDTVSGNGKGSDVDDSAQAVVSDTEKAEPEIENHEQEFRDILLELRRTVNKRVRAEKTYLAEIRDIVNQLEALLKSPPENKPSFLERMFRRG